MRCCILVAGLPASGKTTFARHAARELRLPMISKDRIKEILYDTVGFRSKSEKVALSVASSGLLYYMAESMMEAGLTFILEHNFENVMKPVLLRLLEEHQYEPFTVRFGGDIRVIYERYAARNASAGRHGGHKTSDAWPATSDKLFAAPPSLQDFTEEVLARGIADFSVGGRELYVDASDFSRLAYDDILDGLRDALAGREG